MRTSFLSGRRSLALFLSAATAAILTACGGGSSSNIGSFNGTVVTGAPEIRTLSNRADLVSGGDVLVAIVPPSGAAGFSGLKVDVDGRDVTNAFVVGADGSATGVVTGLSNGQNVLSARADNFSQVGSLTITNASRSGPVLSGTQVTPYYCAQPAPVAVSGNTPALVASGLAGQPDASCGIASEFKLYYKTTTANCTLGLPDPVWSLGATATTVPGQPQPAASACFKPYNPAAARPADMAQTTTDAGRTVDYIVRVERGTMNRGIYDIVSLFDPTLGWSANSPQAAWNGKLYFSFGASTGQPRRQVRPATAWPSLDDQLRRGYIVAMNSMTDSSRNSNRVLMSETVMMMKEHITDNYGPVKFTIGSGCSGGSINSNMAASIMPGLLDGVITSCTYPDSDSTALEVGDCTLLVEAYQKPDLLSLWTTLGLTQAQVNARKAAINGHGDQTACHGWYNLFGSNGKAGLYFQRTVPAANHDSGVIAQAVTATNNCELPNTAVYDPANPVGTASLPRCNAWSWAENIWGKVPGSPQARDTRDNVGVQYGLKALKDGVIGAEEFVMLNELIGGTDRDSTPRAARTTADPEALDIAYRAGIVMSGKQLAKTAIIDLRGWDDSVLAANVPPGYVGALGIHHIWYSFAIRDRLAAESDSKDARNQAMWRFSRPSLVGPAALSVEAMSTMDAWLTALKADGGSASLEQRVRSARPAAAADFCYLNSDSSFSTKVTNMATCDADPYLKPTLSPRQVAGGPRAENILKCQLKPLAQSDYAASTFTALQWARLQAVFAGGVCDWSKPGVGQQAAVSPLSFKAGPGGAALPAAPVSSAR
ncbi:DUF6351 family protein [Ramlibacter solisilvae]|uniref:DUF6351 domain-containing protein n=1 Tax=Ramlibacter tataouinensis TaxID=94132 RepID=A0A127JT57_9BURK|nr:DUF6351 family protein [Ramlibacter tataouinensis]AMO23089.1 hypothetical protein UC35_09530 [Ramlibacter tataouinensis]